MFHLITLFNNIVNGKAVSYTCGEILDNIHDTSLLTELYCRQSYNWNRNYLHTSFRKSIYRVSCRFNFEKFISYKTKKKYLDAIHPGDIAYIWPPYDRRTMEMIKKKGAILIAERINCMDILVKEALIPAYRHIGKELPEGWCTEESMKEELYQMNLCDYIFTPNREVYRSCKMSLIPENRLLLTSYGWSPERFSNVIEYKRPERLPTFIFIGSGCVRKGLPLLLEIWKEAKVRGKLVLVGEIDQELKQQYSKILSRNDVLNPGFVADVGSYIKEADVFVFPSHEEGGPMVTYEAGGCGLPSIVSPMGSGMFVRDGIEGFVIDPFNKKEWINAIKQLAEDKELRSRMSNAARERSSLFTWKEVGKKRRRLILDVLS